MAAVKRIDQVVNVVGLFQPQAGFLVTNALERLEQGCTMEVITNEKDFSNLLPPQQDQTKYSVTESGEVFGNFYYTILKK